MAHDLLIQNGTLLDPQTGESTRHDAAGIFHLRGMTDEEYVSDAIASGQRSGLLAVDLETLQTRTLSAEWGAPTLIHTDEGAVVVYAAPDQPVREFALVGVWVDADRDPFTVYEDRSTDAPPEYHPPASEQFEAPPGWMLLWPGSPGAEGDPETWEPEFLLLEVLTGNGQTYTHEMSSPR